MPANPWLTVVRVAGVWMAAAAAGWATFRLFGGPMESGPLRSVIWLGALAATLGLGMILTRLTERAGRSTAELDGPTGGVAGERWLAVLAAGLGMTTAMGWNLGVYAGGPGAGLVIGVVSVAVLSGRPVWRLGAAAMLGLGAMALCILAVGEPPGVSGLLLVPAGGLVVFTLASLALRATTRPALVATLTTSWGIAWIGSYHVAATLPQDGALPTVVEIVLACTAGGLATGWLLRQASGEPVPVVTARWAVTGVIAVIGGFGVAAALDSLGFGSGDGPTGMLDVGTTVALPLGAIVAVLPLLRRLTRDQEPIR